MGEALRPVVGVIPARYGSTRLSGKVLADLGGRTLIRRVYDRAVLARGLDSVLVATDDERVLREALAFGARVALTSRDHRSGTDRIAEAVGSSAPEAGSIINIQGDEPFLDPATIDAIVDAMPRDPDAIWTAVAPLADPALLERPEVVKAAMAADGRILYFSRAAIPHVRADRSATGLHWHHIGVYGYSRPMLDRFVEMEESPLERAEGLEQLRALEAGIAIRAVKVATAAGGIDTQEDLDRARLRFTDEAPRGGRE